MLRLLRGCALTLAALLLLLVPARPAGADTTAGGSMQGGMMINACNNADAMMMKMAHSGDAMMPSKMSGKPDADFGKMMMAHQGDMMAMAKLEAKCGKSAAVRADAQKMVDLLTQLRADLEAIMRTP